MNIVLIAEEAAGLHVLRLLINNAMIPKAVLSGTAREDDQNPIAKVARGYDIPVMPAVLVKKPSFRNWLVENNIDVLLNIHALYIICEPVYTAPRKGSFNLHPGALPDYAGRNAPSWAIYHGENTHSVTLHTIVQGIDKGDVVAKATFNLGAHDTGLTVSNTCVEMGLPLIHQLLSDLHTGTPLQAAAQPPSGAPPYTAKQIPNNGFIDWSRPAVAIDAFVRACNYAPFPSPWGYPKLSPGNNTLALLRIYATDQPCNVAPGTVGAMVDGGVLIASADYWMTVSRCRIGETFVPAASVLQTGDALAG